MYFQTFFKGFTLRQLAHRVLLQCCFVFCFLPQKARRLLEKKITTVAFMSGNLGLEETHLGYLPPKCSENKQKLIILRWFSNVLLLSWFCLLDFGNIWGPQILAQFSLDFAGILRISSWDVSTWQFQIYLRIPVTLLIAYIVFWYRLFLSPCSSRLLASEASLLS